MTNRTARALGTAFAAAVVGGTALLSYTLGTAGKRHHGEKQLGLGQSRAEEAREKIEQGVQEQPELQHVYGGSFVNDAGGLTVLSTELSEQLADAFAHLAGGVDFILLRCRYSLKELEKLQEEILQKAAEHEIPVTSSSILPGENRITIKLQHQPDEKERAFWTSFGKPDAIRLCARLPR